MGKRPNLANLKCMFKRWHSSPNLRRSTSSAAATPIADSSEGVDTWQAENQDGLRPVYVGKSRRRYLISAHLVDHPLLRILAERSSESDGMTVGCEVVLFEHLLWMLENADPPPESLDELVEFYAC